MPNDGPNLFRRALVSSLELISNSYCSFGENTLLDYCEPRVGDGAKLRLRYVRLPRGHYCQLH